MSEIHCMRIDVAEKYGVNSALILYHLDFWITKNEANGTHYYDGRTWTYNSVRAWHKLFPYWSERQIYRVLSKLEEQGLIEKGNYNTNKYDRTSWFSLTDLYISIYRNRKMENPEPENVLITDNIQIKRGGRFAPPSLDEVKEYVKENGYSVDAENFVDFYGSKGWMIGKNKMRCWKSAVRTWQRKEKKAKPEINTQLLGL